MMRRSSLDEVWDEHVMAPIKREGLQEPELVMIPSYLPVHHQSADGLHPGAGGEESGAEGGGAAAGAGGAALVGECAA